MFSIANIKKTWYYLQKNGVADTYYAVRERLYAKNSERYPSKGYVYEPLSEAELERQRKVSFRNPYRFSILVPMYETGTEFAKAMMDSVLAQTYPYWELILVDASETNRVQDTVSRYKDERIRYHRLAGNDGISENTNAALAYASGDYIGLLDHDDLLTPDALFEMASCLEQAEQEGKNIAYLYSDEDKCDTNAKQYYEPNVKPGFNLDLLFSNNYICHFLLMKADLMKRLQFQKEYDGAQDFDLILRASLFKEPESEILHVGKVLYHWRCHEASTAANPRSKQYAYESGKRAVLDAMKRYLETLHGDTKANEGKENEGKAISIKKEEDILWVNQIPVKVVHTKHNGFYRVVYGEETAEDIFAIRKDIGIIAGSVRKNNKITGGIREKDGTPTYLGMHAKFSGYLHRNALVQDCEWVDFDNAVIRPELLMEMQQNMILNPDLIQNSPEVQMEICRYVRKKGYKIVYDPFFAKVRKKVKK